MNFFDADGLTGKDGAEVDLFAAETDASAIGDDNDLVMEGTLAVQMREGQQIAQFGKSFDEKLAAVRSYLPDDLIIARTSDQPLQVKENLDLFMGALYEAINLVVVVSLIGFWEWRSAVLMAISIPITLAMTFGMMHMLGIDIQQASVATLIIALGLLVDDPVVAGDSIKRGLAEGQPNVVAAWVGPTKLATAIMFATVTNIVAYIPFLMLTGTMGEFLYSLPIVMTCSNGPIAQGAMRARVRLGQHVPPFVSVRTELGTQRRKPFRTMLLG